jgi:membrane-associated phospholipid phosphatase
VDLHHSNSFPSGHASTFFVFCTCCVLLLAYRYGQRARQNSQESCILPCVLAVLLVAFAALGAYSRIYLSQHFLSDVCVGSIIGVVTPLLMFYFFGQKILKLGSESHHVPQTE